MRFIDMLHNHPAAGYISSALATTLGLINLLTYVQVVLGVISLSIGVAVGALTLDDQIRRRLRRRNPSKYKDEDGEST